ncbi:hypothetical protein X739_28130 [Mesorhizobium sp. LNHC220B00]|nr:hypothetical protein X739_28130 [Mesorhizobium sp. LNHC220B00]
MGNELSERLQPLRIVRIVDNSAEIMPVEDVEATGRFYDEPS